MNLFSINPNKKIKILKNSIKRNSSKIEKNEKKIKELHKQIETKQHEFINLERELIGHPLEKYPEKRLQKNKVNKKWVELSDEVRSLEKKNKALKQINERYNKQKQKLLIQISIVQGRLKFN